MFKFQMIIVKFEPQISRYIRYYTISIAVSITGLEIQIQI